MAEFVRPLFAFIEEAVGSGNSVLVSLAYTYYMYNGYIYVMDMCAYLTCDMAITNENAYFRCIAWRVRIAREPLEYVF
jgi:hypothetical protein